MPTDKRSIVSQDTLIPLSLATSLFGLIFWISGIASTTAQNKADIEYIREQRQKFDIKLSEKLDDQISALSDLKATVTAIDAKVTIMRETQVREMNKPEMGP